MVHARLAVQRWATQPTVVRHFVARLAHASPCDDVTVSVILAFRRAVHYACFWMSSWIAQTAVIADVPVGAHAPALLRVAKTSRPAYRATEAHAVIINQHGITKTAVCIGTESMWAGAVAGVRVTI